MSNCLMNPTVLTIFLLLLFASLIFSDAKQVCTGATTADDVLQGRDLSGQVYIITGGDTGIGYANAVALAAKNATVWLGNRDPLGRGRSAAEKIKQLTGNKHVFSEKLELASFDSVQQFADTVTRTTLRIDAIIFNAAAFGSPLSHPLTDDGFDTVFQVNILSTALLVKLLLPILRASQSRVVIVSSSSSDHNACHWGGYPATCTSVSSLAYEFRHGCNGSATISAPLGESAAPCTNYALTKYMQVFLAAEMARAEPGILAFSLHPGIVNTSNFGANPPDPAVLARWCRNEPYCPFTIERGAATQVYLSTAPTEDIAPLNGLFFNKCAPAISARSHMVQEIGENATSLYQEQLYAMIQEAIERKAVTLIF